MGTYDIVIDINTLIEYYHEYRTNHFIDFKNQRVLIVSDGYDEEFDSESDMIEIPNQEHTNEFTEVFRVDHIFTYDTLKDFCRTFQIDEMEADLDYMKSHGEHGSDCSDCNYNHYDVNVEPCTSCVDYCNHSKNNTLSTNPDFEPNGIKNMVKENIHFSPTVPETLDNTIEYKPTGKLDKEIKCTTMNDICGPLKETFGKYVGPLLMNDIHNKSIKHIKFIIDYLWADELKAFQEHTEYVIQSQDDLQSWIDVCENYIMTHDNLETSEDPVNHVFYHLMKLKKLYNL